MAIQPSSTSAQPSPDDILRKKILAAPEFRPTIVLRSGGNFQPLSVTDPASEILPYLFLGNQDHAISLLDGTTVNKNNFDILVAIGWCKPFNQKSTLDHIHLAKSVGSAFLRDPSSSASNWMEFIRNFHRAHEIIKNAKIKSKKVLLYCDPNSSISSIIVLYYLMVEYSFSLKECMSYLQQCRRFSFPKLHFRLALHFFQQNKSLPSIWQIDEIIKSQEESKKIALDNEDDDQFFAADPEFGGDRDRFLVADPFSGTYE